MNNFIEMTEDEWFKTYKPIPNHIDKNASFGDGEHGYMFETYGEEIEFVKNSNTNHIWMYGEGDDGGTFIWSGWGFVNRLGYFITEVPFPANTDIQVLISLPSFYCENCDAEFDDPNNLIRDKFQEADLDKCPNCATIEELQQLEKEPHND